MNGPLPLGPPAEEADAPKVSGNVITGDRAPARATHQAESVDLLTRPSGVFAPLVAVLVSTVAFIASQLVRPAGELTGLPLTLTLGLSGTLAVLSIAGLAAITRWWGRIPHERLLIGSYVGSMVVGMGFVSVLDGGLSSVLPLAFMPIAAYLALVLPARSSWPALGGLLVLLGVVGAAGGVDRIDGAVVLFVMVVVSFVAGLLPRRAQEHAIARSVRLARTDELTGLLNRRGFAEQADHSLFRAAQASAPVALALIDLDAFKLINDREGHAAGDELLAWVGARLSADAPAEAIVGRTGGDEFAILLPGASAVQAQVIARLLRERLRERVGASIGVAATPDAAWADRVTLLQHADELLYRAKHEPREPVQLRERVTGASPQPSPVPRLTFDALRTGTAGGAPPTSLAHPQWLLHGHLISLATGTLLIAGTWLWGQDSFWADWLRWSGLVWIAASVGWALVLRGRDLDPERPATWLLAPAIVLAAVGIMDAALADGRGITAPVVGAFVLAIINLGAVARRAVALRATAVFAAAWLATAVLGPGNVLWAAPFSASLLVSSTILGVVARATMAEAAQTERRLALEDPLTGVLNRRAFTAAVEQAREDAPTAHAGYLAVDLDDFKGVNDRLGHAAGDWLLTGVAHAMQGALGAGWVVGRIGGDEFVAFTPAIGPTALDAAARSLDQALTEVAAGSVGAAQFGVDGLTLADVAAAADRRSYARKLARRTTTRAGERTA